MAKLRVLHVLEDSRLAGPQLRLFRVASHLHQQVDTILLCPSLEAEELKERASQVGVAIKTVDFLPIRRSVLGLLNYLLTLLQTVLKIRSEIKRIDPQVVHCSGGAWQVRAALAAILARKPVVWHLNDSSIPLPFKLLSKLIFPYVDHFICASTRVSKYYGLEDRTNVSLVDAPVDFSKVPQDFKICENKIKNFVVVCSISPVKGLELTLEAIRKVVERDMTKPHFTIIGPVYESQAEYKARLDAFVQTNGLGDYIRFHGPSTNVLFELENYDCYICSSISEASPTAVWEAAAMGLEIISTDVGNIREKLGASKAVSIVKPGDVDGLADAISAKLQVARSRETSSELSAMVQESTSLESVSKKTFQIYAGLVQ